MTDAILLIFNKECFRGSSSACPLSSARRCMSRYAKRLRPFANVDQACTKFGDADYSAPLGSFFVAAPCCRRAHVRFWNLTIFGDLSRLATMPQCCEAGQNSRIKFMTEGKLKAGIEFVAEVGC
jgi:hypothetical protein